MNFQTKKAKLWMLVAVSFFTVASGVLMLFIGDQVKLQAAPLHSLDMLFVVISNLCGVMAISLGGVFLTLFLLVMALGYGKESPDTNKEEAKQL
jgi:hypothetical protein